MSDLFLRPLFTWRSALASPFGPSNPTTRHVLLTLSLHMNEKGESCFPSIELLVEESGLSRRAVIEHLRVANEAGWIGKRERAEKTGQGWRRIEYFPLIPKGVEQKVQEWDEGRRARHAPPSKDVQRGDGHAPRQRGAESAPAKGGAPHHKGGAPDGTDAVQDVHLSTSGSTSKRGSAAERRTRLPKNFEISERVKRWYAEKGYPASLLPAHLEKFIRTVKANGKKYVDWDEAFMNCIADDWGEVRKKTLLAAHGGAGGGLAWYSTEEGTLAKGKEIGIEPRAGESWAAFRGRINALLEAASRVSA